VRKTENQALKIGLPCKHVSSAGWILGIDSLHAAIRKHLHGDHNQKNKDLNEQFTILKKCCGKFETVRA